MGAGILPVAYHNNKYYFLFSKEYQIKNKNFIDWRDFGGGKENNETIKETAIREAMEETNGFLGTKSDIKFLIEKRCLYKIKTKNYFLFIVLINYDKTLPKRFKKAFDKIAKAHPEKLAKNGLYEKEKLKWIRLENIPKHMDKFQPWYKKIVKRIMIAFNNFNKN